MTATNTDITRYRMLFLLERLPPKLRSDVLAAPEFVEAFEGFVQYPVRLDPDTVIAREELFETFRDLFDGRAREHLTKMDGSRVKVQISSEPGGVGAVRVGKTVCLFRHADLLARDPSTRMAAFERPGSFRTLTLAEEGFWRKRLKAAPLDDDSFVALAKIIGATPEEFSIELEQVLINGELRHLDFLPDDVSYWDRLIPAPEGSDTLDDFVHSTLDIRRRARLARDFDDGLRRIALEFGAPRLVPHTLLDPYGDHLPDTLAKVAALDDHFGLVGAFEICAKRVGADKRFAPVGSSLLKRLLSSMESLEARCSVFGSIFVFATARLAQHEDLQRRPVYWRRLAAAAHASLVTRTIGIDGVNHSELLPWAMRVAGAPFLVSCLLDRAVEPGWRPQWIGRRELVADAIGRILSAWNLLDEEARPDEWRTYVNAAHQWINETGSALASISPALLEGGRADPTGQGLPDFLDQVVATFLTDPTPASARRLVPMVFNPTADVPEEVVATLKETIEMRLKETAIDTDDRQSALLCAVHVAVGRKNAALADAVAQESLEIALYSQDVSLVNNAILTIIECTGAYTNHAQGDDLLVERLERLALWRYNPIIANVLQMLVPAIKRVRPSLRTRMGRTLAAIELAPQMIDGREGRYPG